MRGQWFIGGTWLPLEEEESDLIEQEHLNHFRGQQMQDTFETDLVVRTVDSKDGELWGRALLKQYGWDKVILRMCSRWNLSFYVIISVNTGSNLTMASFDDWWACVWSWLFAIH